MKPNFHRAPPRVLPRGRVAAWSKEQLDKLSIPELRTLLENAERLKETEVAALCNEILDGRPRGHAPTRRRRVAGEARELVARNAAFEMHGVQVRNRIWSRGGVRADGGVLLALGAEDVERSPGVHRCMLWGPNVDASRPWSDSPGGQERLEHCRLALERSDTEAMLLYAKRADAQTVLKLTVEQRGDEYWASWVPERPVVHVLE